MTCCTSTYRSRLAPSEPADVEVTGTWDFKWPAGSQIRVAFQAPPGRAVDDADVRAAIFEIRKLACLWTGQPPERAQKPKDMLSPAAISFAWVPHTFPAPSKEEPQRGSFFDSDESRRPDRDYDVLVSLEALPLALSDPLSGTFPRKVFLPKADLGVFFRRSDYSVPNVYIGPIGAAVGSLADYYGGNQVARHYVVHEFGHVLGLAHEHQNPLRDFGEPQLTAKETANRMRQWLATNGAKPDVSQEELEEFVLRQLHSKWPGNRDFSDWRQDGDSVMMLPYFQCLIGNHGYEGGQCLDCEKAVFDRPTPSDLAMLAAMYPAR